MESHEQTLYELFNCHRHFYIENQRKVIWGTEMENKVTKQQDKKKNKAFKTIKDTINILLSDQTL